MPEPYDTYQYVDVNFSAVTRSYDVAPGGNKAVDIYGSIQVFDDELREEFPQDVAEDGDGELVIGHIKATLVDLWRCDRLFDAYDCRSGHMAQAYEMFLKRDEVKDRVLVKLGMDGARWHLNVSELVIKRQHRGHGCGKLAMQCLREFVSREYVVATLRAYPLEIENPTPKDFRRLASYYLKSDLGFERIAPLGWLAADWSL